eukprot:1641302-Pyramimonas_sp.AAC.1
MPRTIRVVRRRDPPYERVGHFGLSVAHLDPISRALELGRTVGCPTACAVFSLQDRANAAVILTRL